MPTGVIITALMVFLVILSLAVSTLSWLWDLKKKDCRCAEDANYKFIIFMCFYIITVGSIGFALKLAKFRGVTAATPLIRIMGVINLVLIITFIVIGLKYIKQLKEKHCACALDDPRRKLFEAWMWLYVALYALMILLLIVAVIMLVFLTKI